MPIVRSARLTQVALFTTLLGLCFYGYLMYYLAPQRAGMGDVRVFFMAATRFARGENLYDPPYTIGFAASAPITLYYLYPPFLAQWLSPATALSFELFQKLWLAFNCLALAVSAVLMAALVERAGGGREKVIFRVVCAGIGVVGFEPTYWSMREGQIDPTILALLLLYLYCATRNRSLVAGCALGIATALKLSPAVMLLVPILEGQWRTVAAFTLTILCASLILILSTPAGVYEMFPETVLALSRGTLFQEQWLNFGLHRGARVTLAALGVPERLAVELGMGAQALLVLGGVAILLRAAPQRPTVTRIRMRSGIAACLMLLSAPLLWPHHLLWTLLPFAVLVGEGEPQGMLSHRRIFLSGALYVLVGQTLLLRTLASPGIMEGFALLFPSAVVVGIICMLGLPFSARGQVRK